jgi:hypothetical protein
MEVKIGVQHVNRELTIDTTLDADAVQAEVAKALEQGGLFALSDARGRRVVVPGTQLAYVDITTTVPGSVGFRS